MRHARPRERPTRALDPGGARRPFPKVPDPLTAPSPNWRAEAARDRPAPNRTVRSTSAVTKTGVLPNTAEAPIWPA